MKLVGFHYEPKAEIEFTHDDVRVLMRLSESHYSPECRAIGKPGSAGYLWGFHVRFDSDAPPATITEVLPFRTIDILGKLCENCHHQDPDFPKVTKLWMEFTRILKQLNDEYIRLNPGK